MSDFDLARREWMNERAARREQAQSDADARVARLREENSEFDAICKEKESYSEKILYAMRSTPEQAQKELEELKVSHRALRERQSELLRSLGLGDDYLKPRFSCARCEDRGYLEGGAMCDCLKQELNVLRARQSGLFSLFERQTFDTFDATSVSDGMQANCEYLKKYAAAFHPKTSANLLLVGGTGVGKTHLSSAVGRVVLEKGFSVVYEGAMQALSAMEMERFSEQKRETDRLLNCDLLILDDLGTELPGKSSVSFLYYLINSRLIAHRPTMISTNLSDGEMEARYEQRLFSRLTGEYEILLFDGMDRRGQ